MVIWIIGVSSSGKTTAAQILYKKFNKKRKIILDGDEIRSNFYPKLKYSIESRKKNSIFISKLSKFLSNKGFIVIVPILSIFQKHRDSNRKNIKNYYEIFIESDLSILKKRDIKGVYKSEKNIVGKDIKFNKPTKYDFIIENNGSLVQFKKKIEKIYNTINGL